MSNRNIFEDFKGWGWIIIILIICAIFKAIAEAKKREVERLDALMRKATSDLNDINHMKEHYMSLKANLDKKYKCYFILLVTGLSILMAIICISFSINTIGDIVTCFTLPGILLTVFHNYTKKTEKDFFVFLWLKQKIYGEYIDIDSRIKNLTTQQVQANIKIKVIKEEIRILSRPTFN